MAEIDDEVCPAGPVRLDRPDPAVPAQEEHRPRLQRRRSDGRGGEALFPPAGGPAQLQPCNNTEQKKKNWMLLNWKTFKKLNFELSNDVIDSIINAKAGTIERVLLLLRTKMDRSLYEEKAATPSDAPEADQASLRHGGAGRQQDVAQRSPKAAGYGRPTQQPPPRKSEACRTSASPTTPRSGAWKHLLHLKDVRIDDLQSRLEELRPTGQPQVQETKKVAVPRAKCATDSSAAAHCARASEGSALYAQQLTGHIVVDLVQVEARGRRWEAAGAEALAEAAEAAQRRRVGGGGLGGQLLHAARVSSRSLRTVSSSERMVVSSSVACWASSSLAATMAWTFSFSSY
uniref:CH_2 domain-containing protein n=1 Tax=Macrostomum lignano TaxID=282301 RepID=A0A1I8FRB1_9PLAT